MPLQPGPQGGSPEGPPAASGAEGASPPESPSKLRRSSQSLPPRLSIPDSPEPDLAAEPEQDGQPGTEGLGSRAEDEQPAQLAAADAVAAMLGSQDEPGVRCWSLVPICT